MSAPQIESYRFERIVIDLAHAGDVIILPDQAIGEWWRKEGHTLHPGNLDVVFEAAAGEVCVAGQGAYGRIQGTQET